MKKKKSRAEPVALLRAGNMMFPHFLDETTGEHNLLAWQYGERAKSCFLITFSCRYSKMKGDCEQQSQIILLQVITVKFVSQQTPMRKSFQSFFSPETWRSFLHMYVCCLWLFSLQLWQTRNIILRCLTTDGFDFHHSITLFPSRPLNCYFKWATYSKIRYFGGWSFVPKINLNEWFR